MASENDDIVDAVKACLLTSKNGMSITALNSEYKSLEGRNIPYQQLGFPNLPAFIQNLPGIEVTNRNGSPWIRSIPTKETAHIAKLVAQQKTSKRRRRKYPSQKSVRPMSSSYNRYPDVRNTRNNYPSRNHAVSYSTGKPLMQVLVKPPNIPPAGSHIGMTSTPIFSSANRLRERPIQPNQDNDYAIKINRNIPKVTKSSEIVKAPKMSEPPISLLSSTFLPPVSEKKNLSDRLVVVQQPHTFNSSPLNDNLQVTFVNDRASNNAVEEKTITNNESPKEEIKRIARDLGRGDPVYKVAPGTPSTFIGQVQVGAAKFNSYPNEGQTPEDAENLAAARALLELRNEHNALKRPTATIDKDSIIKRLHEIIGENGAFLHKIPELYWQKFNESLPRDWIEKTSTWSGFTLERGVNSMILCRADPPLNCKEPETSLTKEKGFLNPILQINPGQVELPTEPFWAAEVIHVVSTAEIWILLIGENYSDKLKSLTNAMEEHYSKVRAPAEDVVPGEYYAFMDAGTWYRVRVINCDETCNEAEIFFIDIADEDVIGTSSLYPLDRKFRSLPAQALRVSLADLEAFADCKSIQPEIEEYLCGGVFWMMRSNREIDENEAAASVVITDTRGSEDVCANDVIEKIILSTLTPKLGIAGQKHDAYLSHVSTNGDVFVQIKNDGMIVLVKMLNDCTKMIASRENRNEFLPDRVDNKTTYFVKCSDSGNWFRGEFTGVASLDNDEKQRLEFFLIDFGRTIMVETANIVQLEKLSELLVEFPAQATKVHLDKVNANMFAVERFVTRIKELAPPSKLLILEIVEPSSPPVVHLFMRMPEDILGSINNTLVLESESMKETCGDGNNNVRTSRQRVGRTNSKMNVESVTAKALLPPKIGDIGDYFYVHITIAANPSNFTVQPFDTMKDLKVMMENLQSVCINSTNVPHPTLQSIGEGRLYAVKHSDGGWYRGCVMNVIVQEERLTVYFVDYGDVAIVELDKLLPLSRKFLDLPYQAIKARLVGIKPKRKDWSPEDCVRFQELVVEKDLVSVVTVIHDDRHLPDNTVLGLKLIDVSTEDDISIERILVDEGRAVFTD